MASPAAAQPRPQRSPHVASRQVEHHVADMAVVAAADVTLGQLQAHLATAGQWLAVDGQPDRPLGELLIHDSTGPLRLGYGGWRDLLTGIQFTDGRGDLVTVGGTTVKNVAGYDLVKFMVGSHGCFGTPVTVTCRTYRLPEAALAASLEGSWPPSRVTELLAADAPPQWILFTSQGARAGWLGKLREMEMLEPTLSESFPLQNRAFEEDEAERRSLLDVGRERLRIMLAPTHMTAFLEGMHASRYAADPVFGVVWMDVPERFSDLMSQVRARGGYAIWLGKDRPRTIGLHGVARRLLEQLKSQLDPNGQLPPLPKEEE